MATIKDIAKRAQVSVGTVSHVLNSRDELVKPEKRERVLLAMRELRYRPSALTSGSFGKQSMAIGVVIKHLGRHPIVQHPYFAYVLDGVLAAATLKGYMVSVLIEESWDDARSSVRKRLDGRFDGFLVIAQSEKTDLTEIFVERSFPWVTVGGSYQSEFGNVDVDNSAGGYLATQHLLSLGHRRVAYVGGNADALSTSQRKEGYLRAHYDQGLAPSPDLIRSGFYGQQSGFNLTDELLSMPTTERPTALVCGNDFIAFGAMEAASAAGLTIPGDLSIVGFDGIPDSEHSKPALTTICQPMQLIGERAALELISLCAGEIVPRNTLLAPELVVRNSTCPFKVST